MISVNIETLMREGRDLPRLQGRAAKATDKLLHELHAGRKPKFDAKVWLEFKPLLRDVFHGKCAYCESNVDVAGHGDVDLFRPKSLYPHLAYDLRNLLFSCAICNQRFKRDLFPLEGKVARSSKRGSKSKGYANYLASDISKEKPLLLNPYLDQPQEHLAFSDNDEIREVGVTGLTERGRVTIDVLGLNRFELLRWRAETWTHVRTLLETVASTRLASRVEEKLLREVRNSLGDSALYAGAVRQLCRRWLEGLTVELRHTAWSEKLFSWVDETTMSISHKQQLTAEREHEVAREQLRSYSVDTAGPDVMEKFNVSAKRIDRIEIQNLRAIRHLDFTFPALAERESWIMLIGENGVGKSTILQGVALALMGKERANAYGLNASTFVSKGEPKGFVRVHINAVGTVELSFKQNSAEFTVEPPEPKVPLLAYGPTRLLPSETENKPLEDLNIRTDNLFKPTIPLSDAERWLETTAQEDPVAFRSVGRALCRLLLISEKTLPRINGEGRVEIRMPDGWRRISDLSSGYRSVLALVVDIAIGTSGKRAKVEDAVGIVLLDEIEVHLHPKWKISIVERLRKAFPQMSFLVATHEPLCLKGLRDREIVALSRRGSRLVTFAVDMPSVDTLKVDDILTSKDLFELPSSRNRTSPVTIARYSALLNKPLPTEHEKRELRRLGRIISDVLSGSLNPMQREVERVVASVMRELRAGKAGRRLAQDVLAEIRRQASGIGRSNDQG